MAGASGCVACESCEGVACAVEQVAASWSKWEEQVPARRGLAATPLGEREE